MLLALQVLLPLLKLMGRHNYSKALFVQFAELQFLWSRDFAYTCIAHTCVDSGGGVGACLRLAHCVCCDVRCVVGQYAPIGSWYEKMMQFVKERKSHDLQQWQKSVNGINTLRRVRATAARYLGVSRRHGRHTETGATLLKQTAIVENVLKKTCFVLTERELDDAARVPMPTGDRIADVRSEAINVTMAWLTPLVTSLRCGTDDATMFDDALFGSQADVPVDVSSPVGDDDDNDDDDEPYQLPLVFTYA